MHSPRFDEDLFVRWLLSEAIFYGNRGRPVYHPRGGRWASKTRMHKVIFGVLEEFDLPVTRSWYMWGGFVHSAYLESSNFSSFRSAYSKNPRRAIGLRDKVGRIGVPVEKVLGSLRKRIDEVRPQPSREYLIKYYATEPPEEYRSLYLAKQKLSNYFFDISKCRTLKTLVDRSNKIRSCITEFHASASRLIDDERLEESTFNFMDLVENALDKLDFLMEADAKISMHKLLFFNKVKTFFDDFIWSPYACEISERTIKGLRADFEKQKMENPKQKKIREMSCELEKLEVGKGDLQFSPDELLKYKGSVYKNERLAKTLTDMIGIYNRAEDGE